MSKKNTIILGIITSFVVIVVLVASFYPTPDNEGLEGALGKVNKYHDEQTGDENIVLRTEFLKDTAVVGKTIRDLAQFSIFTTQLKQNITEWWIPQLNKYYAGKVNSQVIANLQEYSEFLKNSNETLNQTIITLADLYYKKDNEQTKDIENQLINFVNYVKMVLVKDSILTQTISDIDKYIADNETNTKNRQEIKKLKEVRDRIVLDNFVVASALGDEKMLKAVLGTPVYDVENIVSCRSAAGNGMIRKLEFGSTPVASIIKSYGDIKSYFVYTRSGEIIGNYDGIGVDVASTGYLPVEPPGQNCRPEIRQEPVQNAYFILGIDPPELSGRTIITSEPVEPPGQNCRPELGKIVLTGTSIDWKDDNSPSGGIKGLVYSTQMYCFYNPVSLIKSSTLYKI